MKSSLIVKHKDFLIPEEYLKRAVRSHNSAMGISFMDKHEGGTSLVVAQSEPNQKLNVLEAVQKTQEELKDTEVVFQLLEAPNGFVQDDVQPFTLLKDKNNDPILVAFLAGNFDHHKGGESKRPGEFLFAMKYLLPTMGEFYKKTDGDLDQLVEQMGMPSFKMSMEMAYRDNGTILFMLNDGRTLSFGNNVDARHFDWGRVTSHFDYTEGTISTAKQTMKNRVSSFLGKSPKGETSPVPEKKQENVEPARSSDVKPVENKPKSGYHAFEKKAEEIEQPTASKLKEAPVAGGTPAESGKRIMAAPPQTMKTANNGHFDKINTKRWYKFCACDGGVPREYKKLFEVECWEDRVLSWTNGVRNIKDFRTAATAMGVEVKPSDAPKGTDTAATITKQKDVAPKYVGKPEENVQEHKVPDTLPIISAESKQKFSELRRHKDFVAVLDTSSRKIKSPEELREQEKKIPSAFQQLGLKRAQVRNLGPDECLQMAELCGGDLVAYLLYSMIVENNMLIQRNPNDVDGYLGEGSGEAEQIIPEKQEIKPTGRVLQPVEKPAAAKSTGLFSKMKKIRAA